MFYRFSRQRIPLSAALKAYWPWLSGLVSLSMALALIPDVYIVPAWLIMVAFFGSAFAAAWPWLRLDAPYSFWIVACFIWVGIFGLIVLTRTSMPL